MDFNQFMHKLIMDYEDTPMDFKRSDLFEYDYPSDTVLYSLKYDHPEQERMFKDICSEVLNVNDYSDFELALFHEIGHGLTDVDQFTDEDIDEYENLDLNNFDNEDDFYLAYYHSPIEEEATYAGMDLLLSLEKEDLKEMRKYIKKLGVK